MFVVGNGTSHTSRSNAFVVTRDGVQNSSDINLKDNIIDLKPKGELRLVEFDWKNTGRHSYGFIAQEVE
nr:MAG TPA: endosialidase chaperone [Bacteriophage sp.]